jgi:hypothetical protein
MFRRFSCHTSPLVKLNDYVCSNVCSAQSSSLLPSPTKYTYYPLANYVSYHRYKPAYLFLLLKLVMSWNPTLIWKSLLILSGRKPYVLNCKLSNTMTLGLLLQSQKARHWLVVDGYIKLSTIQMVLSRGTEPNWSQRASFSSKVLIIRIPFLPLPRLSQFTACLCWPQLMTGPFINWTSTMPKFTATYLRKYMSSLPGLV